MWLRALSLASSSSIVSSRVTLCGGFPTSSVPAAFRSNMLGDLVQGCFFGASAVSAMGGLNQKSFDQIS
eukprot:9368884-Ditylum_brightwellii.AAC.1